MKQKLCLQQNNDLILSSYKLPNTDTSLDINKKRELLYKIKKDLIYDFVNNKELTKNLVSLLQEKNHNISLGKNNITNLEDFIEKNKHNKEVLISHLNNTINYKILNSALSSYPQDEKFFPIKNKLDAYLETRNELFFDGIKMVLSIINKRFYNMKRLYEDDLINEGSLMLLDFIEKYNINSPSTFSFFVYSYLPNKLMNSSKALYQLIKITNKDTRDLTKEQIYKITKPKRLTDTFLEVLGQKKHNHDDTQSDLIKNDEKKDLEIALNFLSKNEKIVFEALINENKTNNEIKDSLNISRSLCSLIVCRNIPVLQEIIEARNTPLSKINEKIIKENLFLLSKNDKEAKRGVFPYHLGIFDNKEHTRKEINEEYNDKEWKTNRTLLFAIDYYVKKNEENFKKRILPFVNPDIFNKINLLKLSINVETFKNIRENKEVINAIDSLNNTQKFLIKNIFKFELNKILSQEDIAYNFLNDKRHMNKFKEKIAIQEIDAMQKIKQKSEYAHNQLIEYFEKNYSLKENMKENLENMCILLNQDEAKIFVNALGLFERKKHNLDTIKSFFQINEKNFEKTLKTINKKISIIIKDFDIRNY